MAYELNGTSQLLRAAAGPTYNGTGDLTLACWFWTGSTSSDQVLIAYEGEAGAEGRYILAASGSSTGNKIAAQSGNGSTVQAARTTTSFSVNTWQHAAAVHSGTSSRSAYLDGQGKATNTGTHSFTTNAEYLHIGAIYYPGISLTAAYLNGRVAEAAVWNAALTDAEVAALAAGFTPDQIRPQSLQLYSPLVRDLVDLRAGRSITNVNSATVSTHPRVIQ
jgi:hypothetical protein